MCCFAGPVRDVSNTRIFARLTGNGSQFICYQMEFASDKPNAMILPLPTKVGAGEEDIKFMDLSKYENFFKDLDRGFPDNRPMADSKSRITSAAVDPAPLKVHEVGDFIASFVPNMKDFDRLDPQFAIPSSTWEKIPAYADFSFAVFQLKELQGSTHPMAFEFKTRHPDRIFFPTIHIHDGEVHDEEHFQHRLYCQDPAFDQWTAGTKYTQTTDRKTGLVRSERTAANFVDIARTRGIVDADLHVHRKTMNGRFQNTDVVLQTRQPAVIGANHLPTIRTLTAASMFLPLSWIMKRRIELSAKSQQAN